MASIRFKGHNSNNDTTTCKAQQTMNTFIDLSGVRGVFFNRRSGKWRAMLKFQGKDHYLGEYVKRDDAIKARQRAEEQYFAPLLEKYQK